MATSIIISAGKVRLTALLNDAPTANKLAAMLPLQIAMNRWGDEYYGSLPAALGIGQQPDAREEMAVGELAYWPPGNALCIFFGPTPVSTADEPRAASPVNPVGMIEGDATVLKQMGRSIELTIERAAHPA
ncbi:MAG: cyclophilin-like fold protein [Tepidisphaeraceae bacterium]